jgi:hypothetical protein
VRVDGLIGGECDVGTEPLGCLPAVLERIDGDHRVRTALPDELDDHQPDWPAPHHDHGAADSDAPEIDGVDRHAKRLEHRPVRCRQRWRERVQPPCGPGHDLAQATVTLTVSGEQHRRT